MKNKEKYAKEIVEIACDGNGIAVDKRTGIVCLCNYISCSNCLFDDNHYCDKGRRKWAESEYIEKLVISKRDRAFLEYLDKNMHYIARDLNGGLYVYIGKPHKLIDCWEVGCLENIKCEADKSLRMLDVDFPMVKWEDDEPWLIEDLKKLEVVEDYGYRNTF